MYSEDIPIRFSEANPKSNIFLGVSIIVVIGPFPYFSFCWQMDFPIVENQKASI